MPLWSRWWWALIELFFQVVLPTYLQTLRTTGASVLQMVSVLKIHSVKEAPLQKYRSFPWIWRIWDTLGMITIHPFTIPTYPALGSCAGQAVSWWRQDNILDESSVHYKENAKRKSIIHTHIDAYREKKNISLIRMYSISPSANYIIWYPGNWLNQQFGFYKQKTEK